MASEQGALQTDAPPIAPTVAAPPSLPPPASSEPVAADPERAKSLKRPRETTPTSPNSSVAARHPSSDLSPSKIARLVSLSARLSPVPLTGAAAAEEERRRKEEEQRSNPPGTTENPGQKVIADLLSGGALAMSRPQDAPASAASPVVELAAKALNPGTLPHENAPAAEAHPDAGAQSAEAHQNIGGAGGHVVDSPAPMDIDSRHERSSYVAQPEAQMDDKTATSLSYPGILPPAPAMLAPPQRNMSLPMPSSNNGEQGSPASKKHKCPYCDTEFTRHHNLKSHLLTHSQEKPYVCQTCQMRFRRLHDLKRHSKLHTGEKPHVCPKCDRKFARGDALARHSKGAGGCAGRRASLGSFAGDDDYDTGAGEGDDSAMSGVVYDPSGDVEMTEEDRRRLSLPAIKAQHVPGGPAASEAYTPTSRTYPPSGPRPGTTGGLFPPNVDRGASSSATTSPSMPNSILGAHTPNTSISSVPVSGGGSSIYSQGMTESPKPLSPGAAAVAQPGHEPAGGITRQRSPSLTAQFQQQQYGRRLTDRHTPPAATSPPHGLAAAAQAASGVAAQARGPAGAGHAPSGDSSANLFASGEQGLWSYIQTLEDKVRQLTDRVLTMEKAETTREAQIGYLTTEVSTLRKQLETRQEAPGEKSA